MITLLKRDGKPVQAFARVEDAIRYVHQNHSYSFTWAQKHEGYSYDEINVGDEVKFVFEDEEYEGTVESFSFTPYGIGEFNLSLILDGQPRFIWVKAETLV